MSDTGDTPDKIKVVDRRRFTDEGDVRSEWNPPPRVEAPAAESAPEPSDSDPQPTKQESAPPPPASQSPTGSQGSSPLFLDLVNDLAQQAALFINGAEGFPAQPEHAQRVIDYLGMLESKTRGNLSAEESQILSNLVFQLRSLYLQKKK